LVNRLAPIPGVVAIILFGSVARGEADEYSDLDVLIIFQDRDSLWTSWDSVFKETGKMNLNIHAIPETVEELRKKANPVFVNELEKHGKVIYSRYPFEVFVSSPLRRPFSIVSYDLSELTYKEKMRIVYHLYESGEKRRGVVRQRGGMKLGAGCVLIPQDAGLELKRYLKSSGARVFKIDVLLETVELERIASAASRTLFPTQRAKSGKQFRRQ
jgi:predicted nucleotidyltransferase